MFFSFPPSFITFGFFAKLSLCLFSSSSFTIYCNIFFNLPFSVISVFLYVLCIYFISSYISFSFCFLHTLIQFSCSCLTFFNLKTSFIEFYFFPLFYHFIKISKYRELFIFYNFNHCIIDKRLRFSLFDSTEEPQFSKEVSEEKTGKELENMTGCSICLWNSGIC